MVDGEWWGKGPGQFYDRRSCYLIGTGQMPEPLARPRPDVTYEPEETP